MLTPFINTVIRFAQDGIEVKSIATPLAETAVASVSGCKSFAGVTAAFAMFAAVKTPVVRVVVSLNVIPEDVMEVGMVRI